MTYAPSKLLSLDDFITQYRDNPRYELGDGELIDRSLTRCHETVGGKLATKIGVAITNAQLPWLIPPTYLIQPFADGITAHRPDIILLSWMKLFFSVNPYGNKNQ